MPDKQFHDIAHCRDEPHPMWFLGLVMSLLMPGCAGIDEKPGAVKVNGLSGIRSEDEAEKNLTAIRALLSGQPQQAPSASASSGNRSLEPDAASWPPDWLSSYFSPERSSGRERVVPSVYMPLSASSQFKRRAAPPDFAVKIPKVTEPPSRGSEAEPWPRVPAYTVPAPPGSAYPGKSRCVPDLLGGQRCHAD